MLRIELVLACEFHVVLVGSIVIHRCMNQCC